MKRSVICLIYFVWVGLFSGPDLSNKWIAKGPGANDDWASQSPVSLSELGAAVASTQQGKSLDLSKPVV